MYTVNNKWREIMRDEYEKLYSGVIYDAIIFDLKYDKNFVVHNSIQNVTSTGTFFGRAFTCLGNKVESDKDIDDMVRIDMFKEFFKDSIQVIDTSSDTSVAHFGDISGKLAKKFGSSAVVVDGYTRDVDIISKDNYSVFCKGATPIDAYGRWQIVDYKCDIKLPAMNGGVVNLNSDDYIFADGDGVLVIHSEIVNDVKNLAKDRLKSEDKVRDEVNKTSDIVSLYHKIGRW